jgi:hypothetical protein
VTHAAQLPLDSECARGGKGDLGAGDLEPSGLDSVVAFLMRQIKTGKDLHHVISGP